MEVCWSKTNVLTSVPRNQPRKVVKLAEVKPAANALAAGSGDYGGRDSTAIVWRDVDCSAWVSG